LTHFGHLPPRRVYRQTDLRAIKSWTEPIRCQSPNLMATTMRRRNFLGVLGGAAVWPLATRAQLTAQPVVGILSASSAASVATPLASFREVLRDAGYIEGQNVAIEAQWAEGQYDRLPLLAAELVHRPAAIIVATSLPSVFAAEAATLTIPIVFISGGDPVQLGIVASLNRPGGNITGVNFFAVEVASKRLELLIEVVPAVKVIGMLTDPSNPRTDVEIGKSQAAARTAGKQLLVLKVSGERDIDVAFETLVQERAGAVLIPTDPLFLIWREKLVALAARHALPAMYDVREFAAAGGLLSYGLSLTDAYRLIAGQVARILKGAKPADLPILQPTKLELVVNLRTAKTLGLTIPESFLLRADEVIE
jgi:putative ABC transport system substrate-binding protein